MLTPILRDEARAFVAEHHRHNGPPVSWLFGAALRDEAGTVVAVAMAGRPVARALADGRTIEVTRVCTLEQRNAASRLYGALCRAAQALGYRRAITYNLATESGASLRAAGFRLAEQLPARSSTGWAGAGRGRYAQNLWGEAVLPAAPRNRWERDL